MVLQPEELTLSHVAPPAEQHVDEEDEVASDLTEEIIQGHIVERRISQLVMQDVEIRIAAQLAVEESETETRPDSEPEPVPLAETGAAMPAAAAAPVTPTLVAGNGADAAADRADVAAEPVAQPESVPAQCVKCSSAIFLDSIRFAIPHQPINGKRPV